ncbi:hypothetical protein [Nocardia ninae]|uniref:hypothetical protein n=1 Tax=Nocardia ninae TaxID=356145 RepID=UPI0031E31308
MTQVREFIAPIGGLRDRASEMEMLARFCRGRSPYLWVRADPWAGKSAMLSTFAVKPPADLTVVSFFVTDRLADQNTHTAFTAAILDQLAALLPEHREVISVAAINRDGLRNELLSIAADQEEKAKRRLVLVVDGLDEDTGTPPIAGLLPAQPPQNLRVIVASRHGPELPIPQRHPLTNAKSHLLKPSPFAADIRSRAVTELDTLLRGPNSQRDLLALITAANGLSTSELVGLTVMAPYEIDGLLSAVTGRSFRARASRTDRDDGTNPVYVLAHETLQRTAEHRLGPHHINRALTHLHRWAEHYRDQGWPSHTPDFLLQRYFPVLERHGDLPRMVALALDATRHRLIAKRTGSGWIPLAEIRTVQRHICEQRDPDLLTTVRLARYRDSLYHRSNTTFRWPTNLWGRSAQHVARYWTEAQSGDNNEPGRQHEALARDITDTKQWDDALVRLAEFTAAIDPDRAEILVHDINEPWRRAEALTRIAEVVARTNPDRAEILIHDINEPWRRAEALTRIAEVVARTNPDRCRMDRLADRAEALVGDITDTSRRADARARIAGVVARTDPDRAEALVGDITDAWRRAEALTRIAEVIARTNPDRVDRLADQGELLIRDFTDPWWKANTMARLAGIIAEADPDRATQLADRAEALVGDITDTSRRADALAGIAEAVARTKPDRVDRLIDQGELLIRDITDPWWKAEAQARLAAAVVETDPDRAETLARNIGDPKRQSAALIYLATVVEGANVRFQGRTTPGSSSGRDQSAVATEKPAGIRAKRLLARAWAVWRWEAPLSALAIVDKPILATVVSEVTAESMNSPIHQNPDIGTDL